MQKYFSLVENCVLIGRKGNKIAVPDVVFASHSSAPDGLLEVKLNYFLIVPIENIEGMEGTVPTNSIDLSLKLKSLGNSVTVNLG